MTGVPSQAKRQAILEAATETFLHSGYAASVDEIAAVAGVGKQTVYRHFRDKQTLFLAAVAAARATTTDQRAAGRPRAGHPEAGHPEAGHPEAGHPEAGHPEAGHPDTGHPEAVQPHGDWTFAPDDPTKTLTRLGERILTAALSPTVAALHRLTIAEIGNHPELSDHWGDGAEPFIDHELAAYLRRWDESGVLDVPDPVRAARQFAYLLITEGRMASAYGTKHLTAKRLHTIAAETADLIIRAHRPT
ncbi:TetR/AcrR family transcriptional regulator C-terminal domain-containing protein [Actinoplanes sp. CA-142083]|uniref:TetR/AcrR family transcriptional regulator n=1 Tax=Actinoplanes sp. CA-142083 TaxID=3239903 RepID=UPI003D8A1969